MTDEVDTGTFITKDKHRSEQETMVRMDEGNSIVSWTSIQHEPNSEHQFSLDNVPAPKMTEVKRSFGVNEIVKAVELIS